MKRALDIVGSSVGIAILVIATIFVAPVIRYIQYIDNWSIWLDIKILLGTIRAVLTGRGSR